MMDDMTKLTCLFEYRSGKSHINVAVSPVFTERFSNESSKEKIDNENKSNVEMITLIIIFF
jgi:hypothetical protein